MNPVPGLLRRGADASNGKGRDQRVVDEIADELVLAEEHDAWELGSLALTNMIESAYEGGWQPYDLFHVVRRQQPSSVSTLAAAAILHQATSSDARKRAPEAWIAQLDDLMSSYPKIAARSDASPSLLAAHLRYSGKTDFIGASNQWIAVLTLLGQWQLLPNWPKIGPAPSEWPRTRVPRNSRVPLDSEAPNSKVLGRIRGLLAKADATDYEEEAETFTTKAQELMTRYSIDSLLLGEGAVNVLTRRLHIENPHAPAKAQLLHGIGTVNRVRTIWDPTFAVATVVGSPVDVEQTELLFTSLLIQATRALSRSPKAKQRKGSSSAAFGKAFLYAFAVRIGERLADVDAEALEAAAEESTDLLPMLAAQTVAVDEEFDRMFPSVRTMRGPALDAEGWHSGHDAADEAELR